MQCSGLPGPRVFELVKLYPGDILKRLFISDTGEESLHGHC